MVETEGTEAVVETRIKPLKFQVYLIYLFGSLVLMLVLKVLQAIGGGFSVGTSNFFSVQFLYWHLLADMIYFCTSTVLYPLSGTVSRNFCLFMCMFVWLFVCVFVWLFVCKFVCLPV